VNRRRRRFSETDARFFWSAGRLLGGATVSRLTSLGALVVVSRILSPDELGQLTIIQATIGMLAAVSSGGLAIAVIRQVAETRGSNPEATGRYLGATMLITAIGGILVTTAYLGAHKLVASEILQSSGDANLVLASAGSIVFATLTGAIQGGLVGLEGFGAAGLAQWIQAVATSAGLVIGAVLADVTGALAGFSLGFLISTAAGGSLLLREARRVAVPLSSRLKRAEWRQLWRIGLPGFAALVTVTAAPLGGQLLLAHQGGYADVAAFNVAYRWHLALLFIPVAIAPVLLPIMTNLRSQRRAGEVRRLFRLNIILVLALTAIPATLVAIGSAQILALNGAFYSSHAEILVILAIASIPSALNNVLSSTSLSLGAVRAWVFSDLVFGAVFFGAALVLVGSQGGTGLGVACLAAYVATDAVLVWPVWSRVSRDPDRERLAPSLDVEQSV
jgi:O-antigen/teichoic acid export membrane protein